MGIRAQCGHCGAEFSCHESLVGAQLGCPQCGKWVAIKTEASSPPEATASAASPEAAEAAKNAPTRPAISEVELEALLKELSSGIRRPRFGTSYAIASFVVLGLMILLPLIYVGLIGGIGYGVYYHLTHHVGMFGAVRGREGLLVLGAYVAPAVVGVLMIVFMLKPLVASPERPRVGLRHDRKRDPALEAFINAIADAVGAPRPKSLEFSMEVNASAGPRRGLVSLLRSDLKLVIGVPLAAGMTVRQLGGVLAHEFGHFSQSTGMLLSLLILRIQQWFARVVYGRDEWDASLQRAAEEIDFRVAWILYLAQAGVWISRMVLHGLMLLGGVMSRRLSQQMEFDADRYEARVAGSEHFAETLMRLPVLNYGFQLAVQSVRAQLERQELVDDLPGLIARKARQLPKQAVAQIRQQELDQSGSWFSTHPTPRERIENALREQAPGILTADLPSAALFADFGLFCREATRHYFGNDHGLPVANLRAVSVKEALQRNNSTDPRHEAALAYLTTPLLLLRTIPLEKETLVPLASVDDAKAPLVRLREEILAARPETLQRYEDFQMAYTEGTRGLQAAAIHQCQLNSKSVPLPKDLSSPGDATRFLEGIGTRLNAAGVALSRYERELGERIGWGLRAWLTANPADRRRDRLGVWVDSLNRYAALQPGKARLLGACSKLETALEHASQNSKNPRWVAGVERLRQEVMNETEQFYAGLQAIPHPTAAPESGQTAALACAAEIPMFLEAGAAHTFASELLTRANLLHYEIWWAVLAIAAEGESGVGLSPLPAVKQAGEED